MDENLQIADELLTECAKARIVMEMEIGVVGGEEDDVVGEMSDKLLLDPEDALRTAETLGTGERGCYLLAATFGNVHGVYKPGHVKLRPELLNELQRAVGDKVGKDKPFDLVFHGGSGSLLAEIRESITYGVIKRNVVHRHPVRPHPADRRPHAQELRRRAQGRRRRGREEDLRSPHLHGLGRAVDGRPGRAGLRGPPVGGDVDGRRLTSAVRLRPWARPGCG